MKRFVGAFVGNDCEGGLRAGTAGSWAILCLILAPAFAGEEPSSSIAAPPAAGLIASPEPGWPQWRGPRRDGVSDEKGLLGSWPEGGPKLVWKVDGLGRGWSSPIVVGERLYVTGDVDDDLVIFALDTAGALQWQAKNGKAWKGSFPGSRACCAFSEGRLYHLNAHGRLACLDADSGSELWAFHVLERFGGKQITWALSECLLVDGPRVIVTPGGSKALMAALDKRTGQAVWTTEPLGDDHTSHSSPILFRHAGRRLIAHCSSSHGFGIDADSGELLWSVPLKNQYKTNVSTPVYGSGCVYYVTPYAENGRLYRLRPSGQGAVRGSPDPAHSTPARSGDLRRAPPSGQGIDAEHVWSCPLDTVTGSGVLVDGVLYSAGYRKPKSWLAVDWQTGETKHELEALTTGAAVYADGRLYVLDERGNVGLVEPGAEGLQITGRFRLFDDRARDAWAHPVLTGGRLYLRYHEALWCYDVKRR